MKRKLKAYIFLGFCLLVTHSFFSCSARQEMVLELSGEGGGSMEILLHPVLAFYLTDLSMVMGSDEELESFPIFDELGIWNGFARNNSVDLVSVDIPERERLLLEWRFTDINAAFSEYPASERKVLFFKKEGETRIFEFYLAPENYYQVAEYFPVIDEELLAYFGPNPDDPVPEDVYIEDLEFALEDYLGDESVNDILEDSIISFTVKTEGTILSSNGGKRIPGGVRFETPLIKFLTLSEPIFYRIEFSSE